MVTCKDLPPPVIVVRNKVNPWIGLYRNFVARLAINEKNGILDEYATMQENTMLIKVAVPHSFSVCRMWKKSPFCHMSTHPLNTAPKLGKNDFSGTQAVQA